MFFVLSREKIISYLISLFMVIFLLGIAIYRRDNGKVKTVYSNKYESNYSNTNNENKWILFILSDTIILFK